MEEHPPEHDKVFIVMTARVLCRGVAVIDIIIMEVGNGFWGG